MIPIRFTGWRRVPDNFGMRCDGSYNRWGILNGDCDRDVTWEAVQVCPLTQDRPLLWWFCDECAKREKDLSAREV